MTRKKLATILLSLLLLLPVAAHGANFQFDELNQNENIFIYANHFEHGFFVNGSRIQLGSSPASILLPVTSDPVSFSGSWSNPYPPDPITRTMYIVESEDPSLVSVIIDYTIISNAGISNILGTFHPDEYPGSLGYLPEGVSPDDVYVEDGQFVDIYYSYMHGEFRSDFDPIPLPPSLMLLGSGLLGIVGTRIKQTYKR